MLAKMYNYLHFSTEPMLRVMFNVTAEMPSIRHKQIELTNLIEWKNETCETRTFHELRRQFFLN